MTFLVSFVRQFSVFSISKDQPLYSDIQTINHMELCQSSLYTIVLWTEEAKADHPYVGKGSNLLACDWKDHDISSVFRFLFISFFSWICSQLTGSLQLWESFSFSPNSRSGQHLTAGLIVDGGDFLRPETNVSPVVRPAVLPPLSNWLVSIREDQGASAGPSWFNVQSQLSRVLPCFLWPAGRSTGKYTDLSPVLLH